MDHIDPPVLDYEVLYKACASDYGYPKTEERRTRLLASVAEVLAVGEEYQRLAATNRFAKFPSVEGCGQATKDDLVSLYNDKFVPNGSPGRSAYLELRGRAHRGICPLCDHLPVSTLDHYLPKAKFPAVVVLPANLVPACRNCNTNKLSNALDLTLHPYYDDVRDQVWLKCCIHHTNPVSVSYEVIEGVYNSDTTTRLRNHMKYLKVAELYESQAISHLADIRRQLVDLFTAGGPGAVQAHLDEGLQSRQERRLNSWSSALYRGLAQSSWFLNGGLGNIAI